MERNRKFFFFFFKKKGFKFDKRKETEENDFKLYFRCKSNSSGKSRTIVQGVIVGYGGMTWLNENAVTPREYACQQHSLSLARNRKS